MELLIPSITEISKDSGENVFKVMEAKFMDLENQVTKINGALKILYSSYSKGGVGWPYENFDLPVLLPMDEDERVVKIEEVKSIIAGLAEESKKKFFKKGFIKTGLSTPSSLAPRDPEAADPEASPPPDAAPAAAPPPPPPAAAAAAASSSSVSPDGILQFVGGKKKTYKKRHTKKKRRHTKRRSTKRKHYKKTRKH